MRLRYRIDRVRMRWRVTFGGNPPGLLAAPRQRRKVRRDIANTAGLVLAVAGFFVIVIAVAVVVALAN